MNPLRLALLLALFSGHVLTSDNKGRSGTNGLHPDQLFDAMKFAHSLVLNPNLFTVFDPSGEFARRAELGGDGFEWGHGMMNGLGAQTSPSTQSSSPDTSGRKARSDFCSI